MYRSKPYTYLQICLVVLVVLEQLRDSLGVVCPAVMGSSCIVGAVAGCVEVAPVDQPEMKHAS